MNHRWRRQRNGSRACIRCTLVVYHKHGQLWARWPEGASRQIGWVDSRRRLVALGACPRPDIEVTPPKPRGGDQWRGRSRSARAVTLVRTRGYTVTRAAHHVGLSPQAVSMALARHRLKERRTRRRKKEP